MAGVTALLSLGLTGAASLGLTPSASPSPGLTGRVAIDRAGALRIASTRDDPSPSALAGPGQAADTVIARETGARGLLPEEMRRAYGIDELHARGLRGQGQVVAILSFDTFLDSDLAAWDRATGTQGGPVERLVVNGPVALGPGSGEVNLDIQMIRAIAPEATIVDVEAPPGTSYAALVEAILRDGRADIASLSWGHCEALGDAFPEHRAWFEDLVRTEDATFRRAFDEGLTIFAIPGDEGVFGCVRSAPEEYHDLLAVWYPGSHPLVVSVGGTYQWRRDDGTYHHEVTWTGPMSGEATGGGASRFFPMPEWQLQAGLDARSEMRLSPDVAGPGDPDSGLMVVSTPVLQDGAWQPASLRRRLAAALLLVRWRHQPVGTLLGRAGRAHPPGGGGAGPAAGRRWPGPDAAPAAAALPHRGRATRGLPRRDPGEQPARRRDGGVGPGDRPRDPECAGPGGGDLGPASSDGATVR